MGPHRRTLRSLAAVLAALALGCPGVDDAPRPDVVLISLDSVRADYLTFLDEREAPNLARLARRGVLFTEAVTGSSWTLPAHAQMFTGHPPAVHGVHTDELRIDPAMSTLPERLAGAGYRTVGFWTGWYLAGDYGFDRGFEEYRSSMTMGREIDAELRAARSSGDAATAERLSQLRELSNHEDVTSDRLADDALEALAADDDRPLFLFAHLFDPHYDYVPPPPFDTRFDPDYGGSIDGRRFWLNKAIYDPAADPPRRISDRDLDHVLALYRGEIAWTDRAIGRILDGLEARGRLDRTLFVVTSDHGEEFFEHGDRGHRRTLYDEVLRVPLLVVPPGPAAEGRPRRVATQVTLSDVAPTVLDWAGIDPGDVSGRSLRPAVEGGELAPRPAVASLRRVRTLPDGTRQFWITQSVRTETEKLVRTVVLPERGPPQVASLEHFDLTADPRELSPARGPARAEVRAAWARLEDALVPLRESAARLAGSDLETRATRIKDAFATDLHALGYADGGAEAGELPDERGLRALPPMRLPPAARRE